MRIKRLLALLSVAALAVGLTAGVGTSAAPKKLRICLVTDVGGLNDRGFNQLAYQGLLRAQKQLKVEGRVLTSSGPNDYIPNLTTCAREGYNLTIAVGFLMTDAMKNVAPKFGSTRFGIIDVNVEDLKGPKGAIPKNVQGLLFKEQEVGYLAGTMAALVVEANKADQDTISSVGGLKIPPVDRYIAGYQAGAKQIMPGIKLLNGYSQDFVDQAKCKEIALAQITQGSTIVFQVAGACGLGALDAAKEKGVFGIGVDADQGALGQHVMTSAKKRVDQAVFLTVQGLQKNTFKGGRNAVFGVKEGGVGLGRIAKFVPASIIAKVKSVEARIRSGAIRNIPTVVP